MKDEEKKHHRDKIYLIKTELCFFPKKIGSNLETWQTAQRKKLVKLNANSLTAKNLAVSNVLRIVTMLCGAYIGNTFGAHQWSAG